MRTSIGVSSMLGAGVLGRVCGELAVKAFDWGGPSRLLEPEGEFNGGQGVQCFPLVH